MADLLDFDLHVEQDPHLRHQPVHFVRRCVKIPITHSSKAGFSSRVLWPCCPDIFFFLSFLRNIIIAPLWSLISSQDFSLSSYQLLLAEDETRRGTSCILLRCMPMQQAYLALSPAGVLQLFPILDAIWEDMSMDFIEWLLLLLVAYDSIVVVMDRLNKYTHFLALSHPFWA